MDSALSPAASPSNFGPRKEELGEGRLLLGAFSGSKLLLSAAEVYRIEVEPKEAAPKAEDWDAGFGFGSRLALAQKMKERTASRCHFGTTFLSATGLWLRILKGTYHCWTFFSLDFSKWRPAKVSKPSTDLAILF